MEEFAKKLIERLKSVSSRLSIVRNPDGFLSRPDVQQALLNYGLLLLPIRSSLELRVRYELSDKTSDNIVCYIKEPDFVPLPDIAQHITDKGTFSIIDIMPHFNRQELYRYSLSFGQAVSLYEKKYIYTLGPAETRIAVGDAIANYGKDISVIIDELRNVELKWDKSETIVSLSRLIQEAVRQNQYRNIEPVVAEINKDFQQYVDNSYWSFINSMSGVRPKIVSKVLPFIHKKNPKEDETKVALIVIDGMAYWQYLILEHELLELGIVPRNEMTMAWLPSITKLSRQAIFAGDTPKPTYAQNPTNEAKLWSEFWQRRHFADSESEYNHGNVTLGPSRRRRMAFVDVELDHKMHSSSSNKDLYDLTVNWAKETAPSIAEIFNAGYRVYITTDHGNILAHHWRQLSSQEKTFLYQNESRGSRHLIYDAPDHRDEFLASNPDLNTETVLTKDNWLVMRSGLCFKGQDEITHGGSHFLEMVLPFITLEKSNGEES